MSHDEYCEADKLQIYYLFHYLQLHQQKCYQFEIYHNIIGMDESSIFLGGMRKMLSFIKLLTIYFK